MGTVWQDFRYAARTLRKNPGFALVAIFTLALGIGANTAIFSVVNAVLLRPLPYPDADRLVDLSETYPGGFGSVSVPNLEDWRWQTNAFEGIAAYTFRAFSLQGGDSPERLTGERVSANYFDVLGVRPQFGRAFAPEEERAGSDHVVVLSDALWRRDFAADPRIVNRTIPLNGENYTVVGVMPPVANALYKTVQVWAPLVFSDDERTDRGNHLYLSVGRIKPGVTVEQAQAEMDAIARRLAAQYPDADTGRGVRLLRINELLVGAVRRTLLVLMAAVGFVLLIACANVANLLLARAAGRTREIAIRAALGAGRLRLVQQFVTEGFVLSLAGGTLGVLLAWWGMTPLGALAFPFLPRAGEIGIDARVLAFTLAVAALTSVVFGLAPAAQSVHVSVQESLKDGGHGSAVGLGGGWMRSLFVVAEIASAFVLLVGAGLMIRSFVRLQGVEPGLNPEGVLTAKITLPFERYPDIDSTIRFNRQLIERVSALPGVEAAGLTTHLPVEEQGYNGNVVIEGKSYPKNEEPIAEFRVVSPDYFRAVGVRLLRGRLLDEHDREGAQQVVVINETMARQVWRDEDPIGQHVLDEKATVIGVVSDVKNYGLASPAIAEIYSPFTQKLLTGSIIRRNVRLVLRSRLDEASLSEAVRREVRAVDPTLPLYSVRSMREVIGTTLSYQRMSATLVGVLAALALTLALVGIYGVMAYTVAQHTREIGIRMALGAQTSDIIRLVVGRGMFLTAAGVAAGGAGSFALTRFISKLLYGVTATDPLTFAAIAVLLASVALAACLVPARRATKVDPMIALRYE
ncbi:MAG: ABC transporter permease [Pyrinomonadaceae bacterium]